MASKTFYDYQPPNVDAAWLNDVDHAVYNLLGNTKTASNLRSFIHAVQTSDNSVSDIQTGALASRPAAGTANRIYIATDSPQAIYFDTGTSWVIITFDPSNVNITGGSITGITDLSVADGGTGSSTASGARTNLGLGSLATQNSGTVTISGGSITGITDLAITDGGTGSSTASGARTNLGLGTASIHAATDFATAAQGTTADSAVQPSALAAVATSGSYSDLTGVPSLSTVATSGSYTDLTGTPTLGTAASHSVSYFATAAQGTLANSAVQPTNNITVLGSGTATSGYVPTADGSGNVTWGPKTSSTTAASLAQYTSTNTTTNINQTTATPIPWNTTLISDTNITGSGTQITVSTAGIYRLYTSLAYTSTVQRAVIAVQFRVNGTVQSPTGQGGYIRSLGGNNSSSSSLALDLSLAANDVVEVVATLAANSGTVTLQANESVLTIEKAAGVVQSKTNTNANTLGGLLPSAYLHADGSVPLSGSLNFSGNTIDNYTERAAPQVTGSSGTYTIDLSLGRFFPVLLSSNATIAFTNVPTTGIVSFTIQTTMNSTGGWTLSWPTSATFNGGTAPTPSSAAGAVDTYVGYSPDNGSTWRIEQASKGWA